MFTGIDRQISTKNLFISCSFCFCSQTPTTATHDEDDDVDTWIFVTPRNVTGVCVCVCVCGDARHGSPQIATRYRRRRRPAYYIDEARPTEWSRIPDRSFRSHCWRRTAFGDIISREMQPALWWRGVTCSNRADPAIHTSCTRTLHRFILCV